MCLLWAGLPGQGNGLQLEETIPRRLRSDGNGRDIFAMVKLSMSDGILSQPPLCVYPQSLLQSTESFFNCLNSTTSILTQSLDETRAADLNELASVIEVDYPHMGRSVRYLRQITNGDRPRAPYKQLGFISAGPQANAGVGNVQLGRPSPAPKPHKLRVVFHHRAWWRDRFDGFLPRFGVRWKTCYYVIMVCDDRCAVHQIEHLDRRFW